MSPLKDETGWLIEHRTSPPEWWTAEGNSGWTTDSVKATRFSRKKDAEDFMRLALILTPRDLERYVATEHAWIEPRETIL